MKCAWKETLPADVPPLRYVYGIWRLPDYYESLRLLKPPLVRYFDQQVKEVPLYFVTPGQPLFENGVTTVVPNQPERIRFTEGGCMVLAFLESPIGNQPVDWLRGGECGFREPNNPNPEWAKNEHFCAFNGLGRCNDKADIMAAAERVEADYQEHLAVQKRQLEVQTGAQLSVKVSGPAQVEMQGELGPVVQDGEGK